MMPVKVGGLACENACGQNYSYGVSYSDSPNLVNRIVLFAFLFIFIFGTKVHADLVATVPGDFSVSATGAATYTVPITIAPGSGGVQPELFLQYSSQGTGGLLGIGWSVGGLSSISRCPATPARDGKIDGIDFDSSDRFCLDGQPLIAVYASGAPIEQQNIDTYYGQSGTEYRTEIESYSRIISHGSTGNGPSYFTVQTKSGEIVEYGNTSDSLFNPPNADGSSQADALAWQVNKISDRLGNYITVTYYESGGEQYPLKVDYTGNTSAGVVPYNSVEFEYEGNPQAGKRFIGGKSVAVSKRMTKIITKSEGQILREYNLGYENSAVAFQKSILTNITECAGGQCTPATTFEYPTNNFGQYESIGGGNHYIPNDHPSALQEISRTKYGDFNGDGNIDQYYVTGIGSSAPDYIYFGDSEREIFANQIYSIANSTDFNTYVANTIGEGNNDISRIQLGDFNGDGHTDIYYVNGSGSSATDTVYLNNRDLPGGTMTFTVLQSGPGTYVRSYAESVDGAAFDIARVKFGEFNGDGCTDIYYIAGAGSTQNDNVYLSNCNGYFSSATQGPATYISSTVDAGWVDLARFRFADFNGDGLTDVYYINGYGSSVADSVHLSKGDGTFHSPISTLSTYVGGGSYDAAKMDLSRIQLGDFNGDGIPDLYRVEGWGTSSADLIYMGQGDGTFKTTAWPGPATYVGNTIENANLDISRINFGDFNGDGMADVYRIEGYGASAVDQLWLGNPHGWVGIQGGAYNGVNSFISGNSTAAETDMARFSFQDFDSDGITDVYYIKGFGTNELADLYLSEAEHNYVTKITNGLGSIIEAEYSNTAINFGYDTTKGYTRDYTLAAGAGEAFYAGPMQIVTETRINNGLGAQNILTYRYRDAKFSLTGRGFLGFDSRTVFDAANKLEITTNYNQSFPYIGLVSNTETKAEHPSGPLSPSILLTKQSNTYLAKGNITTGPAFPYVYTSTDENYEQQGSTSTLVTTVSTTHSYDNYGNPSFITNSVSDNSGLHFSYSINTYETANTTDWILGRLSAANTVNYSSSSGWSPYRHSTYTYDSNTGQLKTETIEAGTNYEFTKTYGYDNFGNRIGVVVAGYQLPIRLESLTNYDPKGRFPVTLSNALNHTETREYNDPHGAITKITGPNGLSTTFSYDELGRKILETRADGTSTTTIYALCLSTCPSHTTSTVSYKVTTITSGAPTKTEYFDILNRVIISEYINFQGQANRTYIEFDSEGRVARQSLPFKAYNSSSTPAYWTEYTYDNRGRVIEENSSATGLTTISYDGLLTSVTNSLNQTTEEYVNSKGQTLWTKDADNNITTFEYDSHGNLAKTIDAQANEVINTYDLKGRKISMADPDMGTWTYAYDVLDQLVSQTDAKNQTVTMVYDKLGRMTSRTEPEGTTNWTYDTGYKAKGKLSSESMPGGFSRTYTYDIFGRPASTHTVIGGTNYTVTNTYDGFSRVNETIYPNNFTTKNIYNAQGYLQQVQDASNASKVYWNKWNVDEFENTLFYNNGNNSVVYRGHQSSSGRLTSALTSSSGTSVQQLTYTYDAIGNLTERKDIPQNLTETFDYDDLNRLTQSNVVGVGLKTFVYDSIGNITSKSDVGTYTYGQNSAGPHAVTQTVGVLNNTYTYDSNGNQLTGDGRTITWSSYNKPTQIVKGAVTTSFQYGPNRARYEQTLVDTSGTSTTTYIGSIYEKVEKGSLTTHKNFIFAGGQAIAIYETRSNSTSDEFYLSRDHLGSVDTITDDTGAVVEKLSFDAFGKRRQVNWQDAIGVIASIITRGFTGHEHLDGVGLIHMNGRVYDASLGRFASADPHIQFPNNAQSYNRYSYVLNNPLSYTDPSGFFLDKLIGGVKNFFKRAGRVLQKIASHKVLGPLAAVAAAFFTGGLALGGWSISAWQAATLTTKVIAGAIGGFAGGFVGSGGDVKAGLIGAATGAAAGFIGGSTAFGNVGALTPERVLAHGFVGGASSKAQGGSFGSGFTSSAFTKLVSAPISNITKNSPIVGGITASVVGGTVSELTGGKFRNGALTASFQYLFNELVSKGEAKAAIERLRENSATAENIISELEKSKKVWTVTFDESFENAGGTNPYNGEIVINPVLVSRTVFTDANGIEFKRSVDVVVGHELAHGFIAEDVGAYNSTASRSPVNYNNAIVYENKIATELNPNAHQRVVNHYCCYRIEN